MKIINDFLRQLPEREKRITLSTRLTLLRIFMSPCVALFMVKGWWSSAFWCFGSAALSDAFDGALARLRDEQTVLGAWLDPIADKILIITSFFTLACIDTSVVAIPCWFVWLVLSKELLLLAGVAWCYVWFGYVEIRPTVLSKMTTVIQTCFIGWVCACHCFCWAPAKTYVVVLGIVMGMVSASLIQYACIGLQFRRKV